MSQTSIRNAEMHVVDRFFQSIELEDYDALSDLYSPRATIWHNFDNVWQSADDNIAGIRAARSLGKISYVDCRRRLLQDGVVQQHSVQMTRSDGGSVSIDACVVFGFDNGKILTIEEYMDSAALGRLLSMEGS